MHPGVYVNHTGRPSRHQREWAAVLFFWPAALTRESALPNPSRTGDIHIGTGVRRNRTSLPGIRVHRSADFESRVHWLKSPPRSDLRARGHRRGVRGAGPVRGLPGDGRRMPDEGDRRGADRRHPARAGARPRQALPARPSRRPGVGGLLRPGTRMARPRAPTRTAGRGSGSDVSSSTAGRRTAMSTTAPTGCSSSWTAAPSTTTRPPGTRTSPATSMRPSRVGCRRCGSATGRSSAAAA